MERNYARVIVLSHRAHDPFLGHSLLVVSFFFSSDAFNCGIPLRLWLRGTTYWSWYPPLVLRLSAYVTVLRGRANWRTVLPRIGNWDFCVRRHRSYCFLINDKCLLIMCLPRSTIIVKRPDKNRLATDEYGKMRVDLKI